MQTLPEIRLNDDVFVLLKTQRGGLDIYRGKESYLRVGSAEVVFDQIVTHEKMSAVGFPVPIILSKGVHEGRSYYEESSLGRQTLRHVFADDYQREKQVSVEHFEQYLEVTKRFLIAQAKTRVDVDIEEFKAGIHLELLKQELPMYANKIQRRFDQAYERISIYPWVITHGDFNPSNIYAAGIIDFEDSFHAPFGYDAISSIETNNWVPDSNEYEYFASYRLTQPQKERYMKLCDDICSAHALPPLSDVADEFEFCRAMWLCARMHMWPKIQKFRYDLLINKYLQ